MRRPLRLPPRPPHSPVRGVPLPDRAAGGGDTLDLLGDALTTGLSLGVVYALFGLGFAATYSVLGEMNFAYGDALVASSLVAYAANEAGLPALAVILAAILTGGSIGLVIDRVAMAPLRNRRDGLLLVVSGLGAALIVRNVLVTIWGPASRPFPELFGSQVHFGGVAVSISILVATLMIALGLPLLNRMMLKSEVGRTVRAVADDPLAAGLVGVSVSRLSAGVYAAGGALGGLAGVFYGTTYGVMSISLGFKATVIGFIAAVIGGTTTIYGALIGGLVLGVFETTMALYVSSLFKTTLTYAAMIALVIFLPHGLRGKGLQMRV